MTWPQGGDPYGQQQQPGGYDPYAQPQSAQPYSGQPYSGQPYQPYSPQPYQQQPYYPPAPPGTNTMAILSLIFSLVGLFVFPIVCGILGVIFGHVGKKQIAERGESGDGLAMAGLIIGYISLGLWVIGCGCYLAFVFGMLGLGAAGSSSSSSDGYTFILHAVASAF
jgi:hypothetical protein